ESPGKQQLLERQSARQPEAGRITRVVGPYVGRDRHDIPHDEHSHHRQHHPPCAAVHTAAQPLQRRGEQQARAQHHQVLPAIPTQMFSWVSRARHALASPAAATRTRREAPTVARWPKMAKSMSSMQSKISEYSVYAARTQGRDRGASNATPCSANSYTPRVMACCSARAR